MSIFTYYRFTIHSSLKNRVDFQLIRAGTSAGANIREVFYAHSRADFIATLHIALKECSESEYWLELLIEGGYWSDRAILMQCIEVKKLLISSVNTAKNNAKQ